MYVENWSLRMRPSPTACSSTSAEPSPCTTPPSTWPSPVVGLMTRPASWPDQTFITRVSPVSVSTSTSATLADQE